VLRRTGALRLREGDMTREEVLDFVRRNTASAMATVENGQPRVRHMDTPVVDGNGLTFLTGANKSVCRQLLENPDVELCYWGREDGRQIRIRGRMEHLEDEDLKKDIVENRFVFLKPVAEKYGWAAFSLFRLGSGEVRVWRADDPSGGDEVFEF
jgi:uncharacterized pyridoxamine 5'-phosphate oxidase family protein